MTALIDTSALIGLTNPGDLWQEWAEEQFNILKGQGPVILLDIVYAETCAGMDDQHAMDTALGRLGLQRYDNQDEALFLASRAMIKFRDEKRAAQAAGLQDFQKRVLPDMIIGAVAIFESIPLLTANESDFRKWFDGIQLICPEARHKKPKKPK